MSEPASIPLAPPGPVSWADPRREAAFARWLDGIGARHGLQPASLRPASADASFRRYLRVDAPAARTSFIIMDAPPDKEDCRPFVKVAGLMAEAGLNVPRVLEWEEALGFMLLDDLGSRTMMDVIDPRDPPSNQGLYLRAVDALVTWQAASRPGVLPPCDQPLLARELALFPDWYLERHRGVKVEGRLRETLDSVFKQIIERNLAAAQVYVHRDFMPRNLMIAQESPPRLGVLDFQDAVYGPITYDIASLMRDAFLSWDEEFVLDITVRYWQKALKAGLPVDADFGEFYRGVEWMGLQRHLKVAGIFARLTLRDGKPKYLADTPRFIAYIRATAGRYRELTPLLRLVDEVEGTAPATGFAFGRV
jgi:aminoglycoside/choline kinase family phosphotransferase